MQKTYNPTMSFSSPLTSNVLQQGGGGAVGWELVPDPVDVDEWNGVVMDEVVSSLIRP